MYGDFMIIYVITEPNYKNSIWCRQTVSGIKHCAKQKRYEIVITDPESVTKSMTKTVILIGTSTSWMEKTHEKLNLLGIHTIIISYRPENGLDNTSLVLIDHISAARLCMDYLCACKRENIALYGINPNSSADKVKEKCFLERFTDKDVYYNNGNLKECFSEFAQNIKKYNSVICSNDIAAVSLIKNLDSESIKVPEDMFVISFGNTLIGKCFNPGITSVSLNHSELGIQAVRISSYITRSSVPLSVTIKIPSELKVNKTTDFSLPSFSPPRKTYAGRDIDFYEDKTVNEIINIENLLNDCEEIDFCILKFIIEEKTYEEIASLLFSSENTVKYRAKRMMKLLKIDSKPEFAKLISQYVDKNQLDF